MPLPICLVYWNMQIDQPTFDYAKVQSTLEKKFHDYHVLVVPSFNQTEAIDIKIFNAKKINRITFNQLKEEVMKAVERVGKKEEPIAEMHLQH